MKRKIIVSVAAVVIVVSSVAAVSMADSDNTLETLLRDRIKAPSGEFLQKAELPANSPNGMPYGLANFREGMSVEEMKLSGINPTRTSPPSGTPTVSNDTLEIRGSNVEKQATQVSDYNISTFRVGSGQYNVNGVVIDDTAPYIKDGSVLLPLRYVSYALGAGDNSILWDESTQAVALRYNKATKVLVTSSAESKEVYSDQGVLVIAKVGSLELISNGETIKLEVAPEITNGRLMLPLRAITEVFGCGAYWDEQTQTAYIASPKVDTKEGEDKK